MTLADRLKHAMTVRGMNQKQLADAVGVKPPSVNGWLSAKAKFLRGENLLKAAAALGVEQEWLATGHGPRDLDEQKERAPASQFGRPDPETLTSAMEFLGLVSQRQVVPIDFSSDAEALLFAYDLVAQEPAGFNREQAIGQMVEWLRDRRQLNAKVDTGDAGRPRKRGVRKG